MEATYKAACLEAVRDYKAWQKIQSQQTDIIELTYGNLEGMMLRRRAHDAVQAYWILRCDFRKAFRAYLAKSCCYPSITKQAA